MKYLHRISLALIVLALGTATFISCKKGKSDSPAGSDEKPGQIPGIGKAAGKPEGTPFTLPAGVKLVGDIEGNLFTTKATGQECVFDGQGFFVVARIRLHRDAGGQNPLEVVFPGGLIIECLSDKYQHGLLVEKVVVTLPPTAPGGQGAECNVTLLLFCLNEKKDPSDENARYKFGPVTNSSLINEFIQEIKNKKISFSAYGQETDSPYLANVFALQTILWNITERDGMTEADRKTINELPNK